jgi:hypothetical protein
MGMVLFKMILLKGSTKTMGDKKIALLWMALNSEDLEPNMSP